MQYVASFHVVSVVRRLGLGLRHPDKRAGNTRSDQSMPTCLPNGMSCGGSVTDDECSLPLVHALEITFILMMTMMLTLMLTPMLASILMLMLMTSRSNPVYERHDAANQIILISFKRINQKRFWTTSICYLSVYHIRLRTLMLPKYVGESGQLRQSPPICSPSGTEPHLSWIVGTPGGGQICMRQPATSIDVESDWNMDLLDVWDGNLAKLDCLRFSYGRCTGTLAYTCGLTDIDGGRYAFGRDRDRFRLLHPRVRPWQWGAR